MSTFTLVARARLVVGPFGAKMIPVRLVKWSFRGLGKCWNELSCLCIRMEDHDPDQSENG